jgi:hypothetical protein
MPKPANYTDVEILVTLIWAMPKKLTKGQIGRLLGIKSAGQKHWRERLERLREKNLLSVETLDAGELFSGSPIMKYYLSDANLEAIWGQYFVINDGTGETAKDPFLAPFLPCQWDNSSSPGFSKLVGTKFNYYIICAKNEAELSNSLDAITSVKMSYSWKLLDAMLSIGWKLEAYRRMPGLVGKLNEGQKRKFGLMMSIYEKEMGSHPAEYIRFSELFERNFAVLLEKSAKRI